MASKTVEVDVDLGMFTTSEIINHLDEIYIDDEYKDWLLEIIRRGYQPLDAAMWREIHTRMINAGYGEAGTYDPIVDLSFQLGYIK